MVSARICSKDSGYYQISEKGILINCLNTNSNGDNWYVMFRLVIPDKPHYDILYYYQTILKGGHQGNGCAYQSIR